MTRFMGGLLVAVGILLAGTTGLCTGAVIILALPGLLKSPMAMLSASPLLLVGIVPCLIGFGMVRRGNRIIRDWDEAGREE